jgi:hypothetical protein
MLRWGAAAAAVIVIFLAGCPEDASSPGSGESRVEWRSGADQGSTVLVETDDLLVRVACRAYGTETGPYLSLSALTRSDDASARVRFASVFHGRHRFAMADFDRSYRRWDLLGTEPGRVRGRFAYRSADGDRENLSFHGSGGRTDGQCDLQGEATSAPAG